MNRFSFTRRWLTVICAYFLIYVVWGSTYYFIGVALHYIPTFLLGALRFSIAGIILLTICVLRGENVMRPMLVRRSVLSGIILLFVDMAVIMLAQHYVGSSLVAIVASYSHLDHAARYPCMENELPVSLQIDWSIDRVRRCGNALYGTVLFIQWHIQP